MIERLNLSPRQLRTALDLLTAAMIISVAFALAGLTWRIAGHAGTGAITVPSSQSRPSAATDIAPALALAPFGKASVSDATQRTTLPLELRGIVAAQPADLSTAFIAMSGQPAAPFRIGQNVGGATIQGILRDRVILNNAGRVEYLTFPDTAVTPAPGQASAPAAPQVQAAAPPPAATPPQAGTPANIETLLQRFNATQAEGGYRIGANPPAGLAVGDTLVSLNGTSLTDSNAATAAFADAQISGTATLQILRDGKRLTLTVPIR